MKNRIFLALAIIFLTFSANSQHSILFTKTNLTRDYHRIASKYEAVSLNLQKLNEIQISSPQKLELEIPFENKILKLDLNKVSITSPGFEVKVAAPGGKITSANYTQGVFYQGKIEGEVKSFVTFSFFNGQVYGIMSDSKSNITLGGLETNGIPSSSEYVIYRDSELKVSNPFVCETPESPLDLSPGSGISQQSNIHANRTNYVGEPVDIYYECDYAFFQNKGSVDNVVNYVLAFFNNVQQLYANENIHVQISQIKVWTTPDPYVSFTTGSTLLQAFGPAMATDPYIGDYAHFLTTRSIGGGVAYLLPNPCASPRQNRSAVSGIQSSYQNFPVYSWTVQVTTHEQGHNFGSNHTQWCGWTGGALDNCYTPEGGCAPGPAPTNGGTIMSYCHTGPTGINFNNGFGIQPGNRIRTIVGNATCFGSCRLMLSVAKSDATCGQNNGSATVTTTNGTAPFTYTWSNGQTGPTLNNLAPGSYYVKVKDAANCEVMAQAVVANSGSTLSVTVTPSGTASFCTGGNVLLSATNNAGYTYQWNNNGTPISGATSNTYLATVAGNYTVYVTSGACNTTTSAVNVVEASAPSATITASGATTFCSGSSVILNSNTGTGLQYQWHLNGSPISGATNNTYTASATGNYTVTVSAGSCQTTSSSTTVTVNTAPTATITASGPVSFCSPGSVTLSANTGSGYIYQWFNNGSPISAATNNSYTATTSGSFTVRITSSGCETTSSATVVTVYSNPTATITASGSTMFCEGGNVTLNANTGAGLQYQWLRNGSAISGATGSSYNATIGGNYTVTVTAGNCQATSAATTVSVNSSPNATITAAGPLSFCAGGSVILNANTGSGYTYQWYRNAVPVSGANGNSYTATVAGNYTVSVTSTGCQTNSSGVQVTVTTNPDATVSAGGPLNFCSGGSVTLSVPTGNGLQYQWYNNGSVITGATANAYTASSQGSYTVIISAGSCQSTSTASAVTINPAPSSAVTASGPLTFCAGGNVTFSATSGPGYTYQWNKDGSVISGATAISYTATSGGNYSVTVSASGCQVTSTISAVSVTTSPNSVVTASGALNFCEGNSVVLSASSGTGLQFQWFNNGSIIPAATNNSYTATSSGSYTVTVSDGSCQSTSIANSVTVNPAPTANITSTGSLTFCSGGSVLLNASTGTGYTYQWKKDGALISGATNNSYSATTSGSYTVMVSNNGCQLESSPSVVNVATSPDATVSGSGALGFCQGNSVVLTVSSGSGLQYQWFNNGSVITGATNNTYTATTSGNYTITVSAASCQSTSGSNLVSVGTVPAAIVTASGALTFCDGGNVILTASSGSGYTYQWYKDGSAISNATNGAYTATTTGNYTVIVSNSGCTNTSSGTSVSVAPAPNSTVSASGAMNFCDGGSVTLSVASGAGLQYQWLKDGSAIAGATTNTYTATTSGNYTITVSAASCQSTSGSNLVSVGTVPAATITASGALTFCDGGSVILTASSGSGYTYQWYRDGSAISNATNGSYTATTTGNYTVIVSNSGCTNTSTGTSVSVAPAPNSTVSASGVMNFCDGGSVTLSVTSGAGLQYQWLKDGSAIAGATTNTYTATTSGNYTITVSAASCQSTSGSNLVSVGTVPAAIVTAGSALNFCSGNSVTLSASSGTGYAYQWLRDGSAITGATSISYSATTSGNYSVIVSNSGCEATSALTTVTVSPSPNATVNASGTLSFCTGGSVTLDVANASGLQYQWFRDGGPIAGATSNSYTAITSGNYIVTVSSSNCQSTSGSNIVSVNEAPVASITNTGAVSFCQGSSVTLNAATGNGYTYQWLRNGTAINGAVQSTYAANNTGSYSVQVSLGGCSRNSTSINVDVLSAPVVTVTPTISTIEKFQTQTLTASGAASYNWSVQPNVISSTANSAVVRPLTTTTYTIEGTASNGCRSLHSATVQVIGCGAVTNIGALPLGPSRVMVSWSNPEGSVSDSLQYRIAGTSVWTSLYVTGSQHMITQLEANTEYEYRLVALCSTTNAFLPSVNNKFKTSLMAGDVYIKLYPNPVYDIANLEIISNKNFDLNIHIVNNQGQNVLIPVNGENHPAGSVRKSINVHKLTAGMYTIVVSLNGKPYSVKMVIGR